MRKYLLVLLMAVTLLAGCLAGEFALGGVDVQAAEKTYPLIIQPKSGETELTPEQGGTFDVIRVAGSTDESSLTVTADFTDYQKAHSSGNEAVPSTYADFRKLVASNTIELVNALQKYVQDLGINKISPDNKFTGVETGAPVNGKAGLTAGLYLVMQSKKGEGYQSISPLLVLLPMGGASTDGTINPKTQPDPTPTPEKPTTPTPTPTPTGKTAYDPPIKLRKVIKGDKPEEELRFHFVMKADDPSYPQPERSEAFVTGEGEAEIGGINFDRPGSYSYTVYEVSGSDEGWTFDTTMYVVKYVVDEKMNITRTFLRNDDAYSYKEPDRVLVFTNEYEKPKEPDHPTPNEPSNPSNPDHPTPNEPGEPSVPGTPGNPVPENPQSVNPGPEESKPGTPESTEATETTPKTNKVTSPFTGDNSQLALYGGIAAAAVVCLVIWIIVKRKK